MVGAFNRFEESKERRRIERAGNLAGSAADFILHVAVHIGRRGKEASFRRTRADNTVIRENITGIQDRSVDFGTGQLNIADAVRRGVPVAGGAGPQQVAVKRITQALAGYRGHGNGHGNIDLSGRRRGFPKRPGAVNVKLAADNLVDHLKAAVVRESGIPRLFQKLRMDAVKIRADKGGRQ